MAILTYQTKVDTDAMIPKIESQYQNPELYHLIISRMKEMGYDLDTITRKQLSVLDEFHVRGAEVSKELVHGLDLSNKTVLDVGCGIGGPCRMLADEFGCDVTGIDLSSDFVETARALTKLVALHDKVSFVHGNALDLPFEDHSFDVVWTQHVQMNIEDKKRFYSEIKRVLKPGGIFLYYDIFKGDGRDVDYPVPWADEPSFSFLQSIRNMEQILGELGFAKVSSKDQTKQGINFFLKLFFNIKENGPPKLGLNLIMGESTAIKLGNVHSALEDGRIALQSGVYIN